MPLQHSPGNSHLPCPGPLTSATHTSFSCIISEWVLQPFDSFKFRITNDSIISLRVYIQPIEFLVHLHFLCPSEQLLKICNDPSNSSCLASLRPENHRPERAHVESGLCHLWAQNLLRASYLPQNGNEVLEMIHKALWVPGVSLLTPLCLTTSATLNSSPTYQAYARLRAFACSILLAWDPPTHPTCTETCTSLCFMPHLPHGLTQMPLLRIIIIIGPTLKLLFFLFFFPYTMMSSKK